MSDLLWAVVIYLGVCVFAFFGVWVGDKIEAKLWNRRNR